MDQETLREVLKQLLAAKETIDSGCADISGDDTLIYRMMTDLIEMVVDSIKLS